MKTFSLKLGNLELRSCDNYLVLTSEKHTTAEIVEWYDENASCYTVAYWKRTSEGFNLHFVGERPLNCDRSAFWYLAEQGQKMLEMFNEE